jgi:transposase InsO family protein
VNVHRNAKTTPRSREVLARRVLEEGMTPAAAAAAAGVSARTATKWVRRFREEGVRGLEDRSSRPKHSPRSTPTPVVSRVLELRHRKLVAHAIARELRLPRSTVGTILRRHGLGRLPRHEQPQEVKRYEHASPGDMVHVDTKKLGRFERTGHRIHGDRTTRCRGAGWEFVHVAIDDHSRVSFAEVLPDETADTTARFLLRAVEFFHARGVRVRRLLTDNGPNYRSGAVAALCSDLAIGHCFTKPYTPRTNGKAERMVQTLLREWAYVRPYQSSDQRRHALRPFVRYYNGRRPHGGIGMIPPLKRLKPRTTS